MNEQYSERGFLESLRVQRFRSLYDVSLKFRKVNIFIGPNNSGKSNLFEFLRFLYDMTTDSDSYEKYRQRARNLVWCGADNEFHATLRLKCGNEGLLYKISVDRNLRIVEEILKATDQPSEMIFRREAELIFQTRYGERKSVSISPHHLSLFALSKLLYLEECAPGIRNVTEFVRQWRFFDADPQTIKKSLSDPVRLDLLPDMVPPLEPDGRNMAEFLYNLERLSPNDFALVQERFHSAVKLARIEKSYVETPSGIAITYSFKSSSPNLPISYPPEAESDGVVRVLSILSLLLGDRNCSLVCMDEPDRNLSPELMPHIADAMKEYEKSEKPYPQIFVITHHPLFLNCFNPVKESKYLRVFVAERDEVGKTSIRRLDTKGLAWWLGRYPLGELLDRGVLDL